MFTRKELESFEPYTPGEQPLPGSSVTKLNTNENPYPPSPRVWEAIESIRSNGLLRRYPHYSSIEVREVLSKIHGIGIDCILVTNGSDEALRLAFLALLPTGARVVIPDPTYSYYPVLVEQAMCGASLIKVPLLPNLELDTEALQNSKANLLAIANPNAPTGILLNRDKVLGLVQNFAGVVLVDEAYIDFSPIGSSVIREVTLFPNLLVSRTLSKSYGLAGLRVGYLLGNPSLIQAISKLKDSYNLGMIEQAMTKAALEDQLYLNSCVEKIIFERQELAVKLKKKGFDVTPSAANFLFVKPPKGVSPKVLYEDLKKNNVLVRYFSKGISQDYLRVSVGSSEENETFLGVLDQLLG